MTQPVAGIIAEYNPLHSGHVYHIQKTREALSCNIVVALSSHAVQRGELPILSKWTRTRAALLSGADLVFELGTPWVLQPAHAYARDAVNLLSRLGICTHLSFASESGDLDKIQKMSQVSVTSYSKAQTLSQAWKEAAPDQSEFLSPNHILGMEYLRALEHTSMLPFTIARIPLSNGLSSSRQIRERIHQNALDSLGLPDFSMQLLHDDLKLGRAPISLFNAQSVIFYALRSLSAQELGELPESNPGLGKRLQHALSQTNDLATFLDLSRTRRYPVSRIRRILLSALFGLTHSSAQEEAPVRLLGMTKQGRTLLSQIQCEIISRPASAKAELSLESHIGEIQSLFAPSPPLPGREWNTGVIVL
jgi:predicted nucleotidyltransferase